MMGSKPKPGRGGSQGAAQPQPQGTAPGPMGQPGGGYMAAPPLGPGQLPGAGMNWTPNMPPPMPGAGAAPPNVMQLINQMKLAQAQTPAMGYNAPHNRFGGGGNPGVR